MTNQPILNQPPPILALHGNGGGAFRFARLVPHLSPTGRFVAVTLPGFASVPRNPALNSMTDFAHHLHKMVTGKAAIDDGIWVNVDEEKRPLPTPFILLGTGIGGSFALEYAQHYPEMVAGIILHAPVGTRLDTRLFPRLMKLPGMRSLGQWLFSSRLTRPLFRRLLFSHPVPSDYLNQFFDEYRHCTVFGQIFDILTSDWFDSLTPIEAPTALLWGEKERVLSVEQLNDYKALLPNHLVKTVPAWDHFPMIEQPDEYAAVVESLSKQLWTMNKTS